MGIETEKDGRILHIIYSGRMGELYDPLASETLRLEAKLLGLEISPDHRIQGVTPIGNSNGLKLPPNSGYKTIRRGETLILAPRGKNSVEVIDLVKSHK